MVTVRQRDRSLPTGNLVASEAAIEMIDRLDAKVDRWVEQTRDSELPGDELLAGLEFVEAWYERERTRNPKDPQLVE
ncbi:hypothetical protein [Halocatena marina]|nr:hypothetical protein [Halocatena marina]